jgi:hypothetical protein
LALKPIVKKLLFSIEISIFHTSRIQEAYNHKNIGHRELPRTKIEKGALRDYETAFCLALVLLFMEKILQYLCIFHILLNKFEIPKSCEQNNI